MTTRVIAANHSTVKTQTLATFAAVAAAVLLPQMFHVVGAASGAENSYGQMFLPMYLPIILVGLLAGPLVGAVSGLLAPLISFGLTGMPPLVMLPFLTAELVILGLVSGYLSSFKMPSIGKVVLAQLAGKAMFAFTVLLAVYVLGNQAVGADNIVLSIKAGWPGLVLQWVLLPLIIFGVNIRTAQEERK